MSVNMKSTQEQVLDPAGAVMSDLITQDPLWLPTVYIATRANAHSRQACAASVGIRQKMTNEQEDAKCCYIVTDKK